MIQSVVTMLCIAAIAVLGRCSGSAPTEVAGGSSDHGNARVVATVFRSDATPAEGASVTLLKAGFLADTTGAMIGKQQAVVRTTTDNEGFFAVDSVDTGEYVIEVNDGVSSAVRMECLVALNATMVTLPADTLRTYAGVTGQVTLPAGQAAGACIQVYGLDRAVRADTAGRFIIDDLPPGSYTIHVTPALAQWGARDSEQITAASGLVTDMGSVQLQTFAGEDYSTWHYSRRLVINTSASGADIPGDVAGFPLLVRLSAAAFDVAMSRSFIPGADMRFADSRGNHLQYEIEEWDQIGRTASIWVLLDTIKGNNDSQFVTVYCGKAGASIWPHGGTVFDTANGFAGVWHFGPDDLMADATSNRNLAADSGTTPAAGAIGQARYFSGTTFVSVPDAATLEPPNFTLSVWFSRSGTQDSLCKIIQKGNPNEPFGSYAMEFRNQTDVVGFQIAKTDSTYPLIMSKHEIPDGVWCHLAGTYDGATGTSEFFVNGQSRGTFTHPVPINYYTGTDYPLFFGCQIQNKANFRGSIDEVRLSRVVRSGDWIRLCYENQKQGATALLQWR